MDNARVVLVTGAGRGIGRAIAEALAKEGVRVGLLARTASEIDETARAIKQAGGAAAAIAADVSIKQNVAGAVARIEEELGAIDGLVNNAGILGPIAPFWESSVSAWRQVIDVDLIGPAICAHAVIPGMIARRRGCIVNVVTGIIPTPYFSAYGAAKTGLVRLSETLALELKPYGISVFALGPGTTRTAMSTHSMESAEGRRWIPDFAKIFTEGRDLPMERPVNLALELLSGRHDLLSGLVLTPYDDLAAIAAHAAEHPAHTLYKLRIREVPSAGSTR